MPTKNNVKRPWMPAPAPRKMPNSFAVPDGLHKNFYRHAPWLKLRALRLEMEPLCRICQANGRITVAQMVDHVKSIRLGGEPLDLDNTQSLCNKCHSRKSRGERGKTEQ